MSNTVETEILVIGSGLAGAVAALTAAEENKKVILIKKRVKKLFNIEYKIFK